MENLATNSSFSSLRIKEISSIDNFFIQGVGSRAKRFSERSNVTCNRIVHFMRKRVWVNNEKILKNFILEQKKIVFSSEKNSNFNNLFKKTKLNQYLINPHLEPFLSSEASSVHVKIENLHFERIGKVHLNDTYKLEKLSEASEQDCDLGKDINDILGYSYFQWAATQGWKHEDIVEGHKKRLEAYQADLQRIGVKVTIDPINYEDIFKLDGENVIVVSLNEGMGNQMFQAATAYALAKKTGTSFRVLQKKGIEHQKNKRPEPLRDLPYLDEKEMPPIPFVNAWGKNHEEVARMVPENQNNSWFIEGHLQTPDLFDSYREEVLQLFAPSKETMDTLKTRYPAIATDQKTIGVHVRRGDYLRLKDNGKYCFHNLLDDWNYYKQSLEKIDTKDSIVFVLSDDIEYCKKQNVFTSLKNVVFVDQNKSAAEDMYLMSLCKNHVISNGTFAWWGAYLSKEENKVVCYPNKWIGPAWGDYVPKGLPHKDWVEIECQEK